MRIIGYAFFDYIKVFGLYCIWTKSLQRHSSQRVSDIHFVEAQAYCLPMELASLLRVTFGLVLLVSQSLTQQALQWVGTVHCIPPLPYRCLVEVYQTVQNSYSVTVWWEVKTVQYSLPM